VAPVDIPEHGHNDSTRFTWFTEFADGLSRHHRGRGGGTLRCLRRRQPSVPGLRRRAGDTPTTAAYGSPGETVPDELLGLTALEELDLRGSLSALLPRLPDLATLLRLRVLRLNGSTPWSFQPEPGRDLLAGIWAITTLEHLEIDRWGEKTARGQVIRTAFTALPEWFFQLRHLEAADLRYTVLDGPTTDRLRAVFPHVRKDLRDPDAQ
jgi:hypothetical protein